MAARNLEVLWLVSGLMFGCAPWGIGQSLSTTTTVSTETSISSESLTSGLDSTPASDMTDQTGSRVSAGANQGSFSGVNAKLNSLMAQSASLVRSESSTAGKGQPRFGVSAAAFSPGAMTSGFGKSSAAFNSIPAAGSANPTNPSDSGKPSEKMRQGIRPLTSGEAAKAAGAANAPMKQSGQSSTSVSQLVDNGLKQEKAGTSAGAGLASGAGTYIPDSFPDSTRNTALLSPPESTQPAFGLPQDGLAFGFQDLSTMEFLKVDLKAESKGGSGMGKEDRYQRFLNRLHSEQQSSSSSSNGLLQDRPVSPSFSSGFAGRSGAGFGSKPVSPLGQGSGLQTSIH